MIVYRAVLAAFFLGERLGPIGISGCSLCLVGSLIIVLHAPEDKEIATVDEILDYALQPGKKKKTSFLSSLFLLFSGLKTLRVYRIHVLLFNSTLLLTLRDLSYRA